MEKSLLGEFSNIIVRKSFAIFQSTPQPHSSLPKSPINHYRSIPVRKFGRNKNRKKYWEEFRGRAFRAIVLGAFDISSFGIFGRIAGKKKLMYKFPKYSRKSRTNIGENVW